MQLTTLAIVMYAVVVLFQLVTLPVEFNASRRAMTYMDTIGAAAVRAGRRVFRAARLRAHLRGRGPHVHPAAAVAAGPAPGIAARRTWGIDEKGRARPWPTRSSGRAPRRRGPLAGQTRALPRLRAEDTRRAPGARLRRSPVSAAMALAKGALEGVAVRLVGEVSERVEQARLQGRLLHGEGRRAPRCPA